MTLVLCGELLLLYFLSRMVTRSLFMSFTLLFRLRPIAVSLLLAIQFPGTVLHELAHLFTAEILGVKTGKLRLEPESIREEDIQAGSVMVADSDPFRRSLIGLAPLFWGIAALGALSYVIPNLYTSVFSGGVPLFQNNDFYYLLGVGYLLYAVSNTMFPSPEDMHGVVPVLGGLFVLIIIGFFFGLRLQLTGSLLELATQLMTTLTKSIGVVIMINLVLLGITKLLIFFVSRIFRVRVA